MEACGGPRVPITKPSADPRWAVWQYASAGGSGSALALLAISVYLPALAGGFVWDDWIFVTEPLIRRWDGLLSIWLSPADVTDELHYWPIVYSTFWLEHKLWGFHAFGYHAVNLLLHGVNSVLVWRLLVRLEIPGAWLAGALFAIHPVHVESVAWIIERKDLLSTLFYLSTVHTWLRYTESPSTRRLVRCLALFTAAMLSKSIAVTLPAALLLLGWWRTGNVTGRDVARLLPFLVVAAGITAADLFFYWSHSSHPFDYSAVERALIAARALWLYVAQLFWPASLPILYSRWEVSASDPVGWTAVTAGCLLFTALWVGRRRFGRGPLAALVFFVMTLSPVLSFLDFSFLRIAFLADRFQYLASLGPIALVASIAAKSMIQFRSTGQAVATGVILGTLAILSIQTVRQAQAYRDDLTLARHISTAAPGHYFGQIYLALELVAVGRHVEGLSAAERAVQFADGDRGADLSAGVATVGWALLADDRPTRSEEKLRRAVRIGYENSSHLQSLAQALVVQARYDEGLRLYSKLAREDSLNDFAHIGQAEALFQAGNLAGAKDAFSKALPLARHPRTEPTIHRRLGETMHRGGELDAAVEQLDRSLELNPSSVLTLLARAAVEADREQSRGSQSEAERSVHTTELDGRSKSREWLEQARRGVEAAIERDKDRLVFRVLLATVQHRLGEHEEAIATLETAFAASPNRPITRRAHRLMGEILESQGQPAKAEEHYRSALAINPLDADTLKRLAAIHYRANRYEEALPLYRTLAEVTPCDSENVSRLTDTLARLDRHAGVAQPFGSDTVTRQAVDTTSSEQPEICRSPPAAAGVPI